MLELWSHAQDARSAPLRHNLVDFDSRLLLETLIFFAWFLDCFHFLAWKRKVSILIAEYLLIQVEL